MPKHCTQLKTQLENIKALYSDYCLELEKAKISKEYEQALNIQPQLAEAILELGIILDPDKYTELYISTIERKNITNIPLTKADLSFLYDLDYGLHDYFKERDPKIQELLATRTNTKADLALLTGYSEEQISITPEEALFGNIKFHYSHLNLRNLTSATALKLPDSIGGSLDLHNLTSAKDLKLPDSIGGYLDLHNLTSAKDLKLPDSIGGSLYLSSLTSATDLKLPASIGFDLDLQRLTSAKDLKLPDSIGGYLDLHNLTSAKDLKLPANIGGNILLPSLKSKEIDKLRKKYPNLRIVR